MKLFILAAGMGTRLLPLTENIPKCMVKLNNKPLIEWQIEVAKSLGIDDITIIRGYKSEKLDIFKEKYDVKFIENLNFDSTNMVATLFCARNDFGEDFIVSYGDILYKKSVLESLLNSDKNISVVVDLEWEKYWKLRCDNIYDDAESLVIDNDGKITNIGQKVKSIEYIQAQYIGLTRFKGEGIKILNKLYDSRKQESMLNIKSKEPKGVDKLYMTDIIQEIIDLGFPVYNVPIKRNWIEIDNIKDLKIAENLVEVKNDDITLIK